MNRSAYLAVLVAFLVVAAFSVPILLQPNLPKILAVTNPTIKLEYMFACGGGSCLAMPKASLDAEVHVNSNSPLKCLDLHVNGAMESQICWDLTATIQYTDCSSPGRSCTNMRIDTNVTKTVRSVEVSFWLYNGTNNTPIIRAGTAYQVDFLAHFEDGSSAETSATVLAMVEGPTTTSISR